MTLTYLTEILMYNFVFVNWLNGYWIPHTVSEIIHIVNLLTNIILIVNDVYIEPVPPEFINIRI